MINLKYQTLATLSLPTSLYAFYRIKKLKYGILVNILSSIISSISMTNMITLLQHGNFGFLFLFSGFIFSYGIVLPMFFIRKWTNSFNRKTLEPEKSKSN